MILFFLIAANIKGIIIVNLIENVPFICVRNKSQSNMTLMSPVKIELGPQMCYSLSSMLPRSVKFSFKFTNSTLIREYPDKTSDI